MHWSFGKLIYKKKWNSKVDKRYITMALNRVGLKGHNVEPFWFCPKCGCTVSRWTDRSVEYPQKYSRCNCSKCGFLVALIDNSPTIHCFEYKDYDYNIDL
jgi:predicted RNA-binding Zn-ribbon protein involved in translation (DUF1610 family)